MARVAAYDIDVVVDKALMSFWAKRYGGCDVEQLTRVTGLNRHSLYKVFGGKAGLFRAALTRYVESDAQVFIDALGQGRGLDAIERYFALATESIGKQAHSGAGRRGCFITNTVTELGRSDRGVNAIVAHYYQCVECAFVGAIERGQADGSIRGDLDPKPTAKWLMLTGQGLSVAARFNAEASGLNGIVRAALSPI